MKAVGIDIGTTSICLVEYDIQSGEITFSRSASNIFLPGTFCQDPERIFSMTEKLLEESIEKSGVPNFIGVSSQMHGILYADKDGFAVSPYYTWKDQSGKEAFQGETYAAWLTLQTGYAMYTGYGSVTHFYLSQKGKIPNEAVCFLNIGDYIAMRLCQVKSPLMSVTIAASMGGFDLKTMGFDLERLKLAGVPVSYYPKISSAGEEVGKHRGVPVYPAIGDNQASFFAAVGEDRSKICINVGTGSQVSLFDKVLEIPQKGEVRPFTQKGYLYVQASVNGGKVYEKLACFLREIFCEIGGNKTEMDLEEIYKIMQQSANKIKETDLRIIPSLYQGRGESFAYGRIEGLTESNFHLPDLIRAYVSGMAEELYQLYLNFPQNLRSGRTTIVVSGNGVRKNLFLQEEIRKKFAMSVQFCDVTEEAAAGAALYAYRSPELFLGKDRTLK